MCVKYNIIGNYKDYFMLFEPKAKNCVHYVHIQVLANLYLVRVHLEIYIKFTSTFT